MFTIYLMAYNIIKKSETKLINKSTIEWKISQKGISAACEFNEGDPTKRYLNSVNSLWLMPYALYFNQPGS